MNDNKDYFSESSTWTSNNYVDQNDDIIDFRETIDTLIDGKWLIFLVCMMALLIGVIKIISSPPVYQLDALVQVKETNSVLGNIDPMEGLIEKKTLVDTEIVIIKSRMVLGEAVSKLGLEILSQPSYFSIFGATIARRFVSRHKDKISEPLFGYANYAWGGEKIGVKFLEVPKTWINKKITLISGKNGHFKVIESNRKLIAEGQVGKYLEKSIEGEGEFGLFVSELKARPGTEFIISKQSSLNAITLLQRKFSVTEVGKTGILSFTMKSESPMFAMQALNEITNIYVRMNVEQKSAEAQKTQLFLEKQLPGLKAQLERSTAALNEYRLEKGSINLNLETAGVLASVVDLKTQISLLQQKELELLSSFTASHPVVITVNKQIVKLKRQLQVYNKQIEVLPETQQVILRFARDVEVDTHLYTALLNQLQTIKVTKAGTVGDVRIIDYAVLPAGSIEPKKRDIIVVSLVVGLILGIVLVLVRKALNTGLVDPGEIENYLNIPVYAMIPHSAFQKNLNKKKNNNEKNTNILAVLNGEDVAIESIRSLRTTMHFLFLEAKNNVILICGPSPNIGKSFVSVNLASVLSRSGKKILLIDADMRRGSMHKVLGVSRENGLSDLISNLIEPPEAIKTIESSGFDFISTGEIPPNPSELLLHENFEKLIKVFNDQYDLVIIDSPPILAVADASIIGHIAGANLMVIKSGEHSLGELKVSVNRFTQNDVSIKGIILNDLPVKSLAYGYNYNYEKYDYQ